MSTCPLPLPMSAAYHARFVAGAGADVGSSSPGLRFVAVGAEQNAVVLAALVQLQRWVVRCGARLLLALDAQGIIELAEDAQLQEPVTSLRRPGRLRTGTQFAGWFRRRRLDCRGCLGRWGIRRRIGGLSPRRGGGY